MSANFSVSTATTDMAARPSTSFQRFSEYAANRDDKYLLFGSDGDVGIRFDATRNCLVVDGQGQAVEVRGLNMAPDRLTLTEHFLRKPGVNADIQNAAEATREIANPDFELLGTNAVSGSSALYAEGGIALTTAGAANDQVIVLPHLDASQSAWAVTTWGTDQQTRFEAVIRTAASVAAMKIWVGLKLTNTNAIATDNDQAYFLYDTAGAATTTKWHAVYSIAGTDTDTSLNSFSDVAADTTYHLVIDIDSSRIARFYINGTLAATSTALTTATDLIPYVGVMDTAGAAKTIRLFKEQISRKAGA